MLGARTKQINVYGKRSQRVVTASDERPSRRETPNIFDDSEVPIQWAPVVSRMRKRENVIKTEGSTSSSSPSPRVVHVQRRKPLKPPIRRRRPTPASSDDDDTEGEGADPKNEAAQKSSAPAKSTHPRKAINASRTPLAARTLNIPSSPAIARKHKHVSPDMYKKLHKPSPSTVNVDIIVLDEDGKTVGVERRISRVRGEIKRDVVPSAPRASPPKDTSSDTEDEVVVQPRRLQKTTSRRRVYSDDSEGDIPLSSNPVDDTLPDNEDEQPGHLQKASSRRRVLSDDSESDDPPFSTPEPPPPTQGKVTEALAPKPIVHSLSEPTTRFVSSQQRIQHQPPSLPYKNRIPSPIARPRQLTPIRGLRNPSSAIVPPSPPTPSDFDSDVELSDIEFESPSFPNASPYLSDPAVPEYLKPLLQECHQDEYGLHDFSSFIKSFPYDPIVRSSRTEDDGGDYSFKKIGEASYSEVFGIGGVVLKIIPLRNESRANGVIDGTRYQNTDVEGPATSEANDVRKEIIVTRAMGEVCNGFVKLLKAYVVRGRYPELLLRLWDEYNEVKGSESIRPDSFAVAQVYAIIALPNGGSDLEAYTFTNPRKTGWRQACSVFWQVTKALAYAEQLVSFEHRDLHWGQILVKDLPPSAVLQNLSLNPRAGNNLFMDDITHGVQATIIDLGLSRMDASDTNGFEKVYWTPIEEEVFMGEGDYQFDIYRIMREHIGSDWKGFNPLTNVMWLHYIILKLVRSKELKSPGTRAAQTTGAVFSEKECYGSLLEMEKLLAKCVSEVRTRKKAVKKAFKGRGKVQVAVGIQAASIKGFSCAGDVVRYGVSRGWIMPIA